MTDFNTTDFSTTASETTTEDTTEARAHCHLVRFGLAVLAVQGGSGHGLR